MFRQSVCSLLHLAVAVILEDNFIISGELQVWLDRRLNQDDNRGLGEPIKDSKYTETRFFVLIEKKLKPLVNVSSRFSPNECPRTLQLKL